MFDGLREKLGSFTKDVEEAAEVEEIDEEADEPDEDGEVPDETEGSDEEADLSRGEGTTSPEDEADGFDDGPAETGESDGFDDSGRDGTDDGPPIEPGAEGKDGSGEVGEADASEATVGAASAAGAEPAPEADRPAAELEDEDERPEPDVEEGAEVPDGESEDVDAADVDVGTDEESERAVDEPSAPEVDEPENGPGFAQRAKAAALGRVVIDEERLEGPLWELEMALLESDVEMGVAEEILDRVREELVGETRTMLSSTGGVVEEALADAIYEVISVGQFDFDERIAAAEKPVVIVFTGVNGVGKTTSIAKLSRYLEERGHSSVLANGDTYRAGANEQIREHAERLDRKLIAHDQGSDPTAVIYDAVEYAKANGVDVVLGDTAGRLHTDRGLMDQLAKIDRVVGPDMVLFVDEAVAGQDAVSRAREFNEAASIDGAILSKADADSQGGAAISIAHVTGKPILFLGTGQGYDDLVRFDPEEMVDRLLGEEP